ncbi:hypothetical protein [Thalassospira profundimaris]|uniref:hypothetical protein n=1 Tax=Thalassospira profundimaris TaxID=502049 RepID=UPI0011BF94B1|nr:hypothetical protein [Thalassospira profundimaris]
MEGPTLFSDGNKQQILFKKQDRFLKSIPLQEQKAAILITSIKNLYFPEKSLPTQRAAGFQSRQNRQRDGLQ